MSPWIASEADAATVRRALESLDIDGLHVDVMGDCVHLQGVALCYATKRLAAERAQEAAPNACIANELRVAQLPFAEDPEIVRDVAAALDRKAPQAAGRVQVDVREGVVRLDGRALSADERHEIERAVWSARGVTQVRNNIIVEGEASDAEIAAALNEYVRRAMNLQTITVEYRSGIASLMGSISSQAQGEAIEDLVCWHDHVRDVHNELQIAPAAVIPPQLDRVS